MDRHARTCPRMRLLALAVALLPVSASALPTPATAAACAATRSEGRNDSYIPGAPMRASIGKGHVLTGVVRSTRGCRPIRGARIEIFQGGPDGNYSIPRGKSWPYRATVVTSRDGTFSFRGPYPFGGGGVTPHMHMHVSAPGHEAIDTTYFPRTGEKRGRLVLVLARR